MLTAEQRDEFRVRGFVRVPGAFTADEAARMEDRLWHVLGQRHGALRDDPATWEIPLVTGLQPLRTHPVFEPIGGPTTVAVLDDLLGVGEWLRPNHWGSILVSFPAPGTSWDVPHRIWHTDYPYSLPADRLGGALLFSYLNEVPPASGGTLVVEGSPAVVAHFLEQRPKLRRMKMKVTRQALMQSDPWLAALVSPQDGEHRIERFMRHEHRIEDHPVRVVELTGNPGDLVIAHPWLLHTPSPNCGSRPRFMRGQRIRTVA